MAFESMTFYISNENGKKLDDIIKDQYPHLVNIYSKEDLSSQKYEKLKSKEFMTYKEFVNFIDYMKNLNARMTSLVFYMNINGEHYLKRRLNQLIKNDQEDNVGYTVDSVQFQTILTHADENEETTRFMYRFWSYKHLLKTEMPSDEKVYYRVRVLDLKGLDNNAAWEFVKDVSRGAYFLGEGKTIDQLIFANKSEK